MRWIYTASLNNDYRLAGIVPKKHNMNVESMETRQFFVRTHATESIYYSMAMMMMIELDIQT